MERLMQTPMQASTRIVRQSHSPVPLKILDALLRGLVLLALCGPLAAHAQSSQGASSTAPPVAPGFGGFEPDPSVRRINQQMALKRRSERQQQIASDTAHLVRLALELDDDVDKSTSGQLSVSVVKKAEEIEKLAKTIQDKMQRP